MRSIGKIARGGREPVEERRRLLRAFDPSLDAAGVWLVVPCYRVKAHILDVVAKTPAWVDGIVCVDDACPDHSGDFIEQNAKDPRVVVVRLAHNQGVGGATMAGYREAIARGGQVLVKVDGDDQMDLGYIGHLVAPILLGEADYAKGNRFTSISHLQTMPSVRDELHHHCRPCRRESQQERTERKVCDGCQACS